MPHYLFLLHTDETMWAEATDKDWTRMARAHGAFTEAVATDGAAILGGNALQSSSTSTVVRPSPGATAQISDGPFIETKEALGGYYLIDARDLDQAIKLASICPVSAVEIRPVLDMSRWQ
jgi:hypothetical protein